jgi:hypothetical protein
MSARLDALPEGSDRRAMLDVARRFKASWVELGERLVSVRESQSHVGWGYPTFEAYCRRELHIKQETANKLTRSFAFLRDHAPATLEAGDRPAAPPSLDVVDLLSQAQARTKVSADALAQIGQELLTQAAAPSRNDVLKRLRETDPDAFRAKAKPTAAEIKSVPLDLRKALLLAERLRELIDLSADEVSSDVQRSMQQVVAALQAAAQQTASLKAQAKSSDLVQTGQMH